MNDFQGGSQSPQKSSIRRAKHDKEHPFVMISRSMCRDKSISPKAKGILVYLLSLPDGWVVKTSHVAFELAIGRDSLRSGLKELISSGYCRAIQHKNQAGEYEDFDYEFSEDPIFRKAVEQEEGPTSGFEPETGNPFAVRRSDVDAMKRSTSGFEPETGNPAPVNPPLRIENIRTKKEEYPPNPRGGMLCGSSFSSSAKAKSQELPKQSQPIVVLSDSQLGKLYGEYGKMLIDSLITEIEDYCLALGKRYKDYAAAIRNWIRRRQAMPNKGYAAPQNKLRVADTGEYGKQELWDELERKGKEKLKKNAEIARQAAEARRKSS